MIILKDLYYKSQLERFKINPFIIKYQNVLQTYFFVKI